MHQWPIFCKHRHDFPIISITCIQNYTPLFLPKQKKKIWYSVDISLFQVHDYNTKSSIIFNCNPKTIFAGYLKKEKINKNEANFNSWSHDRGNTQEWKQALVIGIRICQEVALNSLEKSCSLFFSSFDLLFLDLVVTFGVVLAGALQDGSSIRWCH